MSFKKISFLLSLCVSLNSFGLYKEREEGKISQEEFERRSAELQSDSDPFALNNQAKVEIPQDLLNTLSDPIKRGSKKKEIVSAEQRREEALEFVKNDYLDGSCFSGDTLVYILDGENQNISKKKIENIQPGDLVWTCDYKEEQCVAKAVKEVFTRKVEKSVKLFLANEEAIHTTANHPFKIARENQSEEWILAGDLELGNLLLTIGGENIELESIEYIYDPLTVYNLEVAANIDGNHNYCVGTNGFIVHNCNPDVAPFPDEIFRSNEAREAYTEGVQEGLELISDVQSVASLGMGAPLKTAVKAGAKKVAKESVKAKRNPAQDKMLSKQEIKKLDAHEIKQEVLGKKAPIARYDLYKDNVGNIYVKPKGGKGSGEPTGYNINDF